MSELTPIEKAKAAVEAAEEALAEAERAKFRLHDEAQRFVAAGEPSEPAARELHRLRLQELADLGAQARATADQARADLQRTKERRDQAARDLDNVERQVSSLRVRADEAERQRARHQAETDSAQRTRDQALADLVAAEALLATLKPKPVAVEPTPPEGEPIAKPEAFPLPARVVHSFGREATRYYDAEGREVTREGRPLTDAAT